MLTALWRCNLDQYIEPKIFDFEVDCGDLLLVEDSPKGKNVFQDIEILSFFYTFI